MRRTRGKSQRSFSTGTGSDRHTGGRHRPSQRERDRESSLQHSINSSESDDLYSNGVSAQNSGRWNTSEKYNGKFTV